MKTEETTCSKHFQKELFTLPTYSPNSLDLKILTMAVESYLQM